MDKLVIRGGRKLTGTLNVSGSKNTALPLMAGALLAGGRTVIDNIPALRDINTFARVISVTGATVDFDAEQHRMVIDATNVTRPEAPYELVKRMRASFYMLGALLARSGRARVSLPGGCAWGPRPVDLHIEGMKAFGAEIELDQGYVVATATGGRLRGGSFTLTPSSVGATVNLLLAASTASGESRIDNAACEPDVIVFGDALKSMGARIEGLGTRTIHVQGVDALTAASLRNCPDRIELGTYMIAAAIAGSPGDRVEIANTKPEHLGDAFMSAFEETGTAVDIDGTTIGVTPTADLKAVSIETGVFPGFPTDLQAQWTVLLGHAGGNAKVVEHIYTDRFKHIPELRRMGLNAIVVGNEVVVEGGSTLSGAQVMSTDLRASVSLVLAGMIAKGETQVLRVYHLDRGYENLEGKLAGAGIDIRRERYDEFADPAS
ncbi:MAG: UDP-N-acetylglucosamine 1-carboxyvinyltransferase [Rhodothermales bacterium]|nr:UDP-N-acetylglucosamine 1-carboxyvinyltransferase [Rhodothermales bacterium]